MATDEADVGGSGRSELPPGDVGPVGTDDGERLEVTAGEYTWAEFMHEHGHGDEIEALYDGLRNPDGSWAVPHGDDWDAVAFDPAEYLGFHPDDLPGYLEDGAGEAKGYWDVFLDYVDPDTTPVVKGVYTWEHFKWEYYYEDDGSKPRAGDGSTVEFDPVEHLGFDPDDVEGVLSNGENIGRKLHEVVDERTVDVDPDLDEDAFFSTVDGRTTVANRYDLEKAVPLAKKAHFREVDRYWVNKPYAFVIIFHSTKENEKKYYLIEPYLNPIESELREFLTGKLRTAIKYADDGIVVDGTPDDRRAVIERETRGLLERYDLYDEDAPGLLEQLRAMLGLSDPPAETGFEVAGAPARPEPAVLVEDSETIDDAQVVKLLYCLKRDFIGYARIDGIKHDINVEDISCDGYESPVFVYHSDYEQIITNVYHGTDRLDDFVVKLAQRSGKGISKRRPQVDATLPDGSRAQLTLGKEVSDHGTNYTIRQFNDVPFTPIDLICWRTFSLEEMAFLWLCIENHKSLIFAGGTASGKTTSLNAVSLFIPSSSKIVSIEDTREVELPQRNWIASVTRPSFSDDDRGDIDEFDLLEAALRQRPEYIVMGEIRGEEGRTLFQVMSTGHTTYTTFHADSVGEVLKRFTTAPINVSKTMFTALDLVSIQTQTRVQGRKVRRNKSLTEINHYDPENDEINVRDVYQWRAESDEFLRMGDAKTLEDITFDRGWDHDRLEDELFRREVVLAYLIVNGLNEYRQVAATLQAFINDPETIMALIATDRLEASLEDLREMESVLIDVDPEKEELVPRPDPDDEMLEHARGILERAEEELFEEYRGDDADAGGLEEALGAVEPATDIVAAPSEDDAPEEPERSDAPAIAEEAERSLEFGGELEGGDATEGATRSTHPDDETDDGRAEDAPIGPDAVDDPAGSEPDRGAGDTADGEDGTARSDEARDDANPRFEDDDGGFDFAASSVEESDDGEEAS